MNQQFECTKIKDGLYLGNIVAAHDYEFLVSNKFGFVVNCTAQIPNVFQHQNIRYLKFKLVDGKPHKLWDETLKKLNKLEKFLQQAEQSSLCCLVHSFHGQNRSLVFIIAYLMRRYQWRLKKTLQFLKAKQIFIGLNNHYIAQLQILQEILVKNSVLSSVWTPPYINYQQQIISKTFLNSIQGKQIKSVEYNHSCELIQQQQPVRQKKQKRVVWLDRLEKKKRKEESVKKTTGQENLKMKAATHVQTVKYHVPQYDMRDIELIKNIQFNANNKRLSSSESLRIKAKGKQREKQKQKQKTIHNNNDRYSNDNKNNNSQYNNQNQNNTNTGNTNCYQQPTTKVTIYEPSQEKNIYQLTINNFISPNFNIINKTQPITKKPKRKQQKQKQKQRQKPSQSKKRPCSAGKKSTQKIIRAQSEKQVPNNGGNNKGGRQGDHIGGKNDECEENAVESQQVVIVSRSEKEHVQINNKEKRSMMGGKQRKQLKKQVDKIQKQKVTQSSLHSLQPLSSLAQQLIKHQQQVGVKRSSTPTRKERKKQSRK